MKDLKGDIILALKQTNRLNIEKLITWLSITDFFTAPSSTNYHCNYEGGLAEHSWNVFDLLVKKNEQFNLMYDYDTLTICGLLHDLCKTGMYVLDMDDPTEAQMSYLNRLCKGKLPTVSGKLNKAYVSDLINWYVNKKVGKEPEYRVSYKVDDKLPLGHGEKSVALAQRHIYLNEEEMLAIRWHMGMFDAGIHFNFPSGYAYRKAVDTCRLVTVLTTADMEASNILEVKEKG